jgi:pilus assembly protein CpaE
VSETPKLLLVGLDPKLPGEFKAALQGVADVRPVLHTATDYRQGVEAARSRRPDLAVVEMTLDLRGLKVFAEELAAGSPETAVVAVFAPHIFGHDVSESAIVIEAMRAGVRDFLRRPVSSTDLRDLFDRLLRRAAAPAACQGKIIAVASNKGGVGKSTLAVNVACGLAQRHPERVLLIDGSLQMGVCASMLDLAPATSFTDAAREHQRLDEVLIRQLATPHDSGLHLLAAPADALEAAEVDEEVMSRVLTLARRAYDYVLVDSFPMLDQVMIAVLDLSDHVYLVLESVVPTILGAGKLVEVLDNLGYDRERQRVVVNRYSGSAGNLRPADVALRIGRDVDHVLPYDERLLVAANLGKPYLLHSRRWFNRFARQVRKLVAEIETLRPATGVARHPKRTPSDNGEANVSG